MSIQPGSMLQRYVIVADHPKREGITSFCFIATDPERAMRRAWMGAFQYFRDDEAVLYGPTEVALGASDEDVDKAVDKIVTAANQGELLPYTREEAFGRS